MNFHTVTSPVFQHYLKFGHKLSVDALFMTSRYTLLGGYAKRGSLSLSLPSYLSSVCVILLMVWFTKSLSHSLTHSRLLGHEVSDAFMVPSGYSTVGSTEIQTDWTDCGSKHSFVLFCFKCSTAACSSNCCSEAVQIIIFKKHIFYSNVCLFFNSQTHLPTELENQFAPGYLVVWSQAQTCITEKRWETARHVKKKKKKKKSTIYRKQPFSPCVLQSQR